MSDKQYIELVNVNELLDFINNQLLIEEEAAMMYRNQMSGVELQAYHRAMEDVKECLERSKFKKTVPRKRKRLDD